VKPPPTDITDMKPKLSDQLNALLAHIERVTDIADQIQHDFHDEVQEGLQAASFAIRTIRNFSRSGGV
jgi:uncharacterized protein (UPF0335 family)